MKVTRIQTQIVQLPADEPLAGGPAVAGATRNFVTLQAQTDDGIEGIGVTFFGGPLTATLKSAVDQLGALVIGEDPLRTEAIAAKLRAAAGPGGIFTLALSAIDIALWDITQWVKIAGMAEAFNLPVVSHLLPEIHVHLVAAVPNGLTVEYMPWSLKLYEETPTVERGELAVPRKPGLGLKFDRDALRRFGAT